MRRGAKDIQIELDEVVKLIPFSAEKGAGRQALLALISEQVGESVQ